MTILFHLAGPKSSDKCPHKRKAEGDLRQTERRGRREEEECHTGAEMGGGGPESRNAGLPEAGGGTGRVLSQGPAGFWTCGLQNCEKVHFCC